MEKLNEVYQDPNLNSKFQFIDCTDPHNAKSWKTRRLVHQQAMKEIGMSRRKSGKLRKPKPAKPIPLDLSALQSLSQEFVRDQTIKMLTKPSWWVGTSGIVDPFVSYPIELDHSGRELIALIFQDKGGQRPLRDAWFATALGDEATFHQVLANSALYQDSLQNGGRMPKESVRSVNHNLHAVQSVKRRLLENQGSVSNGIIGALTAMMVGADLVGAFDRWAVHHSGLKDMVSLRGGIECLDEDERLRVTISWYDPFLPPSFTILSSSRCELRGVYPQDIAPHFPVPKVWAELLLFPQMQSSELPRRNAIRRLWSNCMPGKPGWITIYETLTICSQDLFPFSSAGNELCSAEQSQAGAWINPVVHQLLRFRPLEEFGISSESLIQEGCRIGSILYLAPIWRAFGVQPVYTEVFIGKLRDLLTNNCINWGQLWKLHLWVLFMVAMEAEQFTGIHWYAAKIAILLHEHDVFSWDVAIMYVKEVLWVERIFGGRDQALGREVDRELSKELY